MSTPHVREIRTLTPLAMRAMRRQEARLNAPIVSIRRHTYRDIEGFLILGYRRGDRMTRTKIFTKTRTSAEVIRARVKAGLDVRLEDFAA